YHLYIVNHKMKKRALHWEDNKEWSALEDRSRARMDHLMGYKLSDDPEITRDLDIYGMGSVRTLDQFSAYCGVDFKRKVVSDRAPGCEFVTELYLYKDERIHIPEVDGQYVPRQQKAAAKQQGGGGHSLRIASLAGDHIKDWESFHTVCQDVFGFP